MVCLMGFPLADGSFPVQESVAAVYTNDVGLVFPFNCVYPAALRKVD